MLSLVGISISLWCLNLANADLRPPRITSVRGHSKPVKLQPNTVLSLHCTATGDSPLEYRWQHNGSSIHTKGDRASAYQGVVVIGRLRPEDQGNYRCVVQNDLGVVFSKDVVVRFSYVSDFLLADTDQNIKNVSAEVGKPLQIDCPKFKASSLIKYSWGTANKDGTVFLLPVDARVMIGSSGRLEFAWLKESDVDLIMSKGGISCIIKNIDGTEIRMSHKYKINLTGKASTTEIKPKIIEGLSPVYEAIKGNELILRCTALGRPTPSISWFKNGQKVSEGNGYSFDEFDHVLKLSSITEGMSGQYRCVAKSSVISEESSSQTNIVVKSQPVWINKPRNTITQQFMSKTYNLKCKASGNPAPDYMWYKNGKRLTIDSSKYKVKDNVLEVTELTSGDMGVYQCTAENKFGKIIAGQYLNVTAMPPTFDNVKFGPFKTYLGNKAVLRCNPQGAPGPKKIWEKNGKYIMYDDSKYAQTAQGDLIIFNVNKNDEANYTCNVQNVAGRDEATAALYASKKPPTAAGRRQLTLSNIHYIISVLIVFIIYSFV